MTTENLSRLRQGHLAGVQRLDLSHCGLTEFPREVFQLADSLEILDLSGNRLDRLPDDLHRLSRLQAIFCSDNRFTELPPALGRCERLDMVGFKACRIVEVPAAALPPMLRWLILTDNRIESLPDELGRRPRLQKLMLAGNRLSALPETLADARALELLRIAANRFDRLAPWLVRLPRLSWLAWGGNPEGAAAQMAPDLPLVTVGWSDLRLGPVLGEGASGVIHRVDRMVDGLPQPAALKVFKGAVTSDGLPDTEMAACMAAGTHPGLIGATARVSGHPEGRPALLMPLVGPQWRILAGPPSLRSCTRDVYPEETRLDPVYILQIARDIAGAVDHLHRRGLLHGDLYAHNILVNKDGRAKLGDFGAASFLPAGNGPLSENLQRLEVRAFGCLLEELRQHGGGMQADPVMQQLRPIEAACLSADNAGRPLFPQIESALRAIAPVQP